MKHRHWIKKINWGSWGLIFLGACASPIALTFEGEKIQPFPQPEDFPQCFFLGDFKAIALEGKDNSYQEALYKIKNKVAAHQGTHLQINTTQTDELTTTILGKGYRCPLNEDGKIQQSQIPAKDLETQ